MISPMVSIYSHQKSSPGVECDIPTPSPTAGGSQDTRVGFSQASTPHSHHSRSPSPRQLFGGAPESGLSVETTDARDNILDEVDSDYDPDIYKVILKLGSSG